MTHERATAALIGGIGLLERAIDSTETAAHTIEAIAVKHA